MLRGIATLSAIALFASVAANAYADPVTLRVGGVAPSADLVELMFAKQGIAKHLGKSYDYAPTHMAGTPPVITAIASGDLDIGVFSYSSFALAIENAKMTDLRVIYDEFQDGAPGYYTGEFKVLKDGPIHSIEDMKGRVAASPGAGSALDIAIRAMLKKHDLEDKRDYTIVEAALPNLKSMLLSKKVDLAAAGTTAITDPELQAQTRNLFTQEEAVGRTEMIMLAARDGFLRKNRAAVVDFLEDALRARRFYFDPAHHKEAVAIVAQFTKQPADQLDAWLFTTHDYYRDPNGVPNVVALQNSVDLLKQLGFLKTEIDAKTYVDLGYVKEAAARLK
ncbi:MAG TPA: ABC transporter substrate-binding protein [Stellaceae bacterium]|nr:ABC transporter substrate-binding protein [Stellaceae bacterium]